MLLKVKRFDSDDYYVFNLDRVECIRVTPPLKERERPETCSESCIITLKSGDTLPVSYNVALEVILRMEQKWNT